VPTPKAYRSDFAAFEALCASRSVAALPASPETVTAQLATEPGLAVSIVGRRCAEDRDSLARDVSYRVAAKECGLLRARYSGLLQGFAGDAESAAARNGDRQGRAAAARDRCSLRRRHCPLPPRCGATARPIRREAACLPSTLRGWLSRREFCFPGDTIVESRLLCLAVQIPSAQHLATCFGL
jgi:hypothetical protein